MMNDIRFYVMIWIVKNLFNPKFLKVDSRAILGQAKHETGNWQSAVFKKNKNLFGMMPAKKRKHLHIGAGVGEGDGQAMYKSYFDSVRDYFLRQKAFNISGQSTEDYIIATANSGYAADPAYLEKWRVWYAKVADKIPSAKSILGIFLALIFGVIWVVRKR